MAGVLFFSDFIGGPDNLQIESVFPSTQQTYTYNFGVNITGWTFEVDQQTIVVDPVTFVRSTGEPNFDLSNVIGFFPKAEISSATYVTVVNAATGVVKITIPGGLYTGPILPDARSKVPVTRVGVTWITTSTPPQVETHRWALLQSWEPDVTPGDPTLSTNPLYTAITVGA